MSFFFKRGPPQLKLRLAGLFPAASPRWSQSQPHPARGVFLTVPCSCPFQTHERSCGWKDSDRGGRKDECQASAVSPCDEIGRVRNRGIRSPTWSVVGEIFQGSLGTAAASSHGEAEKRTPACTPQIFRRESLQRLRCIRRVEGPVAKSHQ